MVLFLVIYFKIMITTFYIHLQIKEDKLKSNAEYELRLKRLNERYTSLQNMDTSATEGKLKGLYDKLVVTELELTECKAKLIATAKESELLNGKVETLENDKRTLIAENEDLMQTLEQHKADVERSRQVEHCNESTNKILESKLAELQKTNSELKTKERDLANQVMSLDSQLKARDGELDSLKSAFQQSTGYVVGSFKELKDELNNQLQEKSDDIKNMSTKNEGLAAETKSLSATNSELVTKLEALEHKLISESRKREEAEKVVQEQKQKLATEMKHESYLQSCMQEVWQCLEGSAESETDFVSFLKSRRFWPKIYLFFMKI